MAARLGAGMALVLGLTGCATGMNTPVAAIKTGDWPAAQKETGDEITQDTASRRWMLSRMRAGVCALDAGDDRAALAAFSESFGMMRTQGLNADRTIPAYIVNERVKIWKGEPFEQAMMLAYYGILQAKLHSWDNTRAACDNALFSLRDMDGQSGRELDPKGVAARSRVYEEAKARGLSDDAAKSEADKLFPQHGYLTRPTDFTLGHLLLAIAAQQMERPDEAADHFSRVEQLAPQLWADVQAFKNKRYNTVLVVAYGLGPRKESYGEDRALTRYAPQTPSDDAALVVTQAGTGIPTAHRPVADLNKMAADHRWRDLESVRVIKSKVGSVAAVGGAFVLLDGLERRNRDEALIGLGIAAVGVLMKASAQAPLEYCDTFPQRVFVVPLLIERPGTGITLSLPGRYGAVGLTVSPPQAPESDARMVYVRLPGL